MRVLVFLGVLACVLPCASSTASLDLDVAVPAGSPLEWLEYVPSVEPDSYYGSVPKRKETGDGTGVLGEANPKRPEATSIFNYVKVLTWDLPNHLNWYGRFPTEPPQEVIRTGEGLKISIPYPPEVPPDLYWLASSVFLRKYLHPAELNDAEAIQYLVYLGSPVLAAADAARNQGGADEYVKQITSKIQPIPSKAPEFVKGHNLWENMMVRLTLEDLVIDFPMGLEQSFCARIALLGDLSIKYVVMASKSSHVFLRRNAVYQLGRYKNQEATKALQEVLLNKKEKDLVVRNRAIEALAKRRDTTIVPWLLKELKSADRYTKAYMVFALGMIGSLDAVEPLHKLLKAHRGLGSPSDFDLVTSCLAALGRMRCGGNPDVVKTINAIYLVDRNIPNPAPKLKPDAADYPNTRGETVKQLAALALAQADPDKHMEKVYEMIEASRTKGQRPGEGGRVSRTGNILQGIHPIAKNFLLDTLPRKDKGREYLKEIVGDPKEDETIRAYALYVLATATFTNLAELAKPYTAITWNGSRGLYEPPASLVETSLHALYRAARPEAIEACRKIVEDYLSSPKPPDQGRIPPRRNMRIIRNGQEVKQSPLPWSPHMRYVTGVAIKMLGTVNKAERSLLHRVIERELERRIKLEKALRKDKERVRKEPPKDAKQGQLRGGGYDIQDGLWQIEVSSPDKLLETCLIELGRIADSGDVDLLVDILRNQDAPGKVEAVLALGAIQTAAAVDGIVETLESKDGWLRYMAYRTLKGISGEAFFCDWIYEPEGVRKQSVIDWQDWAADFRIQNPGPELKPKDAPEEEPEPENQEEDPKKEEEPKEKEGEE